MGDVADDIGPGDAVCGADEVRVDDRTEGLAYVGGVGDVAVGGEEDCAGSVCVCSVAVGSVCRVDVAGLLIGVSEVVLMVFRGEVNRACWTYYLESAS